MKKLLLMLAFLPGMVYCVSAQTTSAAPTAMTQEDPLDKYTLDEIYAEIDGLSVFDLKRTREMYVYKCRQQPTDRNKAILARIEKRLNETK